MSGSEVSTHSTEDVQKTKRFFSQIKKIEKITFAKITKFTALSKEKLLCSKVHLIAKDNREIFDSPKLDFQTPAPQNWDFPTFCTDFISKYFAPTSKYFAPTSSRIYLVIGFSTHLRATDIFEVRLLKIGMFNYQEIFSKNQNFKKLFL